MVARHLVAVTGFGRCAGQSGGRVRGGAGAGTELTELGRGSRWWPVTCRTDRGWRVLASVPGEHPLTALSTRRGCWTMGWSGR